MTGPHLVEELLEAIGRDYTQPIWLVGQWAGLDGRLSPAAATRTRRTRWADRKEAWRHFHENPAFARWAERMLADYIDHGLPQTDPSGERRLAFDRDIEYMIYRTLPHTLGPRLAHGAPVPVGFLAGMCSQGASGRGLEAMCRVVQRRLEWLEGSHLFPIERPLDTARALQRMLNTLRLVEAA